MGTGQSLLAGVGQCPLRQLMMASRRTWTRSRAIGDLLQGVAAAMHLDGLPRLRRQFFEDRVDPLEVLLMSEFLLGRSRRCRFTHQDGASDRSRCSVARRREMS